MSLDLSTFWPGVPLLPCLPPPSLPSTPFPLTPPPSPPPLFPSPPPFPTPSPLDIFPSLLTSENDQNPFHTYASFFKSQVHLRRCINTKKKYIFAQEKEKKRKKSTSSVTRSAFLVSVQPHKSHTCSGPPATLHFSPALSLPLRRRVS